MTDIGVLPGVYQDGKLLTVVETGEQRTLS